MDPASTAPAPPFLAADGGQRVPPSTKAVLLHVVRVAFDDAFSPSSATEQLLGLVGGDQLALRRARARLLRATSGPATPLVERALVTLDLAIEAAPDP